MLDVFALQRLSDNPTAAFIFSLWLVTAMSLWVLSSIWAYRKNRNGLTVLNLVISTAIWTFFAGLALLAKDIKFKQLWLGIGFTGVCAIPPYSFLLGRMYQTTYKPLSQSGIIFLGLIPILTVLFVFTNPLHGWMWRSVEVSPVNSLVLQSGWWFWIWIAYSYTMLGLACFYFLRATIQRRGLYRRQALFMLLAMLPPWLMNAYHLVGIDIGVLRYFDLTPLAFGVTAILLGMNHRRHGFIKTGPVARDWVLEHMSQGLLVLDRNMVIQDVNQAFCNLVQQECEELFDKPLYMCYPQYKTQFDTLSLSGGRGHHELFFQDIGWLGIHISPMRRRGWQPPGWIVLIDDINARKKAEIALNETHQAVQEKVDALEEAQRAIHSIGDLVPICQQCGLKLQQEDGTWIPVERYITSHSDSELTHGICPECYNKYFGE